MEIATEEENSLLEAWKKYRVLLNRVDTSTAPDIEWPENETQCKRKKPQTRRMQDVLRLAGKLSIVRVLNDFQPLPIFITAVELFNTQAKRNKLKKRAFPIWQITSE